MQGMTNTNTTWKQTAAGWKRVDLAVDAPRLDIAPCEITVDDGRTVRVEFFGYCDGGRDAVYAKAVA